MHKGFSLIELLSSLAIGLICILVVVEVFVDYKKTHSIENAVAEIQENGRFAAHILYNSVEQAGFIGCAKLTEIFPVDDDGVMPINKLTFADSFLASQGENNQWYPVLPEIFKLKPKANTDVIIVHNMDVISANLLNPLMNDDEFFVSLEPKFKKGNDVIISDCKHAVLLHLQSVYRSVAKKYQRIIVADKINQSFVVGAAEVGRIKTRAFFIGQTSRKNRAGKKIYALYQVGETGRKAELIPNVVDMKVLCYELSKSGVVLEKMPKQIIDWSKITAIKVHLLLASQDEILEMPKAYKFKQQKHIPSDRRLYKELQLIISLHERVAL
jgi:type IV pilus assembly protein PilW